jgi:Spy/CpxP family protein refolding chaperone
MGGPVATLLTAAKALELPDDQKTKIDAIGEAMHPADEGASTRDAMKNLNATLAEGIKAGKLDKAKIAEHEKALKTAHDARAERQLKALGDLHALLDAEKRKQLVENVKKTQAEREARLAGRPQPAPEDPKRAEERNKRRVDQMTAELGLDEAQQKKVLALLAKEKPAGPPKGKGPDEQKKRMDAVIAAFEKDTFDGKKLDLKGEPPERIESTVAHVAGMLAILKPEQREKFAARYEGRPGFGRGPMMGGRGLGGPGGRGGPGGPRGMPALRPPPPGGPQGAPPADPHAGHGH